MQVLESFFRLFILSALITGFCIALYISYKVVTKNYTLKDILKHFISEKQIDNIMSLLGRPNRKKIQKYEQTIDRKNATIEELNKKVDKMQQNNNKIEKQNGKKEHNMGNKQEKHEENLKQKEIKTQEIEENKINEDELRNTCMIIHSIIIKTYKSFGVYVKYADFRFEDGNAIFGISPEPGIRVKTIINLEKELSLSLRTEIKIKMLSARGYIGIFMPILQFKKLMEEMLKDDRFTECYKICGEEKQDFFVSHMDTKESIKENEIQKLPDSIIEKYYYINGDFTTFSLKDENRIEILGICNTNISAANLYCSFCIKLKEEYLGKFDFSVAINLNESIAIYTNENEIEFFGGKEHNGEVTIGIPDWLDKARDEFLNGNEEEIIKMVNEANNCLDEFMEIAIKYIK